MRFLPMPLHQLARIGFALTLIVVTALAFCEIDDQLITTGWDKTNHLLAFFVLLWLLDLSWPAAGLVLRKVVVLLAYGLLIELIQAFIAYRSSSILDWLADAMGLSVYLLLRPKLLPLVSMLQCLPFIESNFSATKEE